jgi:hypothetical protein
MSVEGDGEVRVMRLKQVILVVVALMLLATGCASEDTAAPTSTTTASTSTTTQPTTTVATTTTTTVATTTTMPVVTDDEEKVAYQSVQEFAEHLRQGDREAAAAFLGPGIGYFDIDFWESVWILDKPEFTDCQVFKETADGSEINCTHVIGEDSFTSLVLGEQVTVNFWAAVDTDGVLTKISSTAPPGTLQAERDFREWIRATHPEDEDRMFGNDAEVFRYGKESAELHMQYLDEYLAYLETKQLDTSEP